MKIAVFTTVFQRLETTLFHMQYMNWLRGVYHASQQLDIYPFYVLSNDDPYLHTYIDQLTRLNMDFTSLPHKNLSTKAQYGLWTLQSREFDYLMHLDSDELPPPSLLGDWMKEMENGVNCFGSTKKIFYLPDSGQAYVFPGYTKVPVVNGGFCIRRCVLDELHWYMWTPGLSFGLNTNQHIRLKNAGFSVHKHNMGFKSPVEIKVETEIALHPLQWYRDEEYELKELQDIDLRKLHVYHCNQLHNYSKVSLS